jgi:hypothetical protein
MTDDQEIRDEMLSLATQLARLMLELDEPQMTYLAKCIGGNFDGQTIGIAVVLADPETEAEIDDELD